MSIQDLTPENSKKALATALNVFNRFLESEHTSLANVRPMLLGDASGAAFFRLMDKFAMYLVFTNGRGGQPRARNTVISYYRHVKNWLLDDYPQHRQALNAKLLKMGRMLERYCLKRQQGGMVKKAPACTKEDLRCLVDGLYYDASSGKEYQDAALLVLMWYAFGRASDLAFVRKCNLSISSDNVLFLRLIRVKTSDEQGLSLFPDQHSFITCPIHAIAVALVMQTFPVGALLDHPHLETVPEPSAPEVQNEVPLMEMLACAGEPGDDDHSSPSRTGQGSRSLKIHAYVNRIVKRASESQANANVTANLSSHSFRRGGAQHANADSNLSAQWIMDRGDWNMTATNKAFAYVFNTTSEDQKVSHVLSGWEADDKPSIPSLHVFDTQTRPQISKLVNTLFASCLSSLDEEVNIDKRVAEILVASLLQHYPEVSDRYPASPYAVRMRTCLCALNISMADVLGWSSSLQKWAGDESRQADSKFPTQQDQFINHQNCVINALLDNNRELTARLAAIEAQVKSASHPTTGATGVQADNLGDNGQGGDSANPKRRAGPPMPAAAVWFEWYTRTPRLWELRSNRQYKSQSKQIVNFMKLFLHEGFKLNPATDDYADAVLVAGRLAEERMLKFLQSKSIKRKFGSGLLKELRRLYLQGEFTELIGEYRARVAVGLVVDPAPDDTKEFA